jgi:RNA polymerase sigma-70 factor (ECF subfamily)
MLNTIAVDAASRKPAAARKTSDEQLIESVAEGDRRAMQALFTRHRTSVLRFAMRIVGNRSIAEEVANEVFQEVWHKADRFQSRSQVLTWLLAITRHKALDTRRQPSSETLDQGFAETIVDEADDPETAMYKNESNGIVRECLTRLSPAHRTIIDLIYLQERSIGEVARMIQVPESTVKTRMFYARKRMEGLLIDKGIDRSSRWIQ